MKTRSVKPLIKWAGGKGQLLDEISARYPEGLGETITKYAEPFVGGGAVLFDILSKYELDEVYISDVNAELINLYNQVKLNVDALIALLGEFHEAHHAMDEANRQADFYAKRDRYNHLIENGQSTNTLEAAALFVFLNRTCLHGL